MKHDATQVEVRSLEEFLDLPVGLIYKHSPRCGTSLDARGVVATFVQQHPELPFLHIDVLAERPLSDQVSAELDVRHHSPQAILVSGGRPVWSATHFRITLSALEQALAEAIAPTPGASA